MTKNVRRTHFHPPVTDFPSPYLARRPDRTAPALHAPRQPAPFQTPTGYRRTCRHDIRETDPGFQTTAPKRGTLVKAAHRWMGVDRKEDALLTRRKPLNTGVDMYPR